MLTEEIRRLVEGATVRLPRRGGQGVLVEGGVILTAAHCLEWNGEGAMALGARYWCDVTTRDGRTFQVEPWAVEPITDVAVLGAVDGQVLFDAGEAFEEWAEGTPAVRVGRDDYPLFEAIPAYVLSHEGEWIAGTVQQCREDAPTLALETMAPVRGGTSGGPIVDESGALIGLVSSAGGVGAVEKGGTSGPCPRPHLALPVWVCRRVLKIR